MRNNIPARLSDAELEAALRRLARCERDATVELIAHLAEFDARRLHLPAGCSSLFAYCTAVLRLSEHGAYNRIEAARAARNFPAILRLLREGALNLSTVRLLAPHLSAGNHAELLASASGKSKRQVEELVARLAPRPDIPASVRKLPVPRPVPVFPVTPAATAAAAPSTPPAAAVPLQGPIAVSAAAEAAPASLPSPPPSARRPLVSPLAPDRYQIRFTASAATCEKLRLAQDLLRHAVPDGDVSEIFDRALTALLGQVARKKLALTQRPRPARPRRAGSRHVPAEVRRAVWSRDGGRCAFIGNGRRCDARGWLEFHHVDPYAIGGEATVDGIQLRCGAHNRYEAQPYFGRRGGAGGQGAVKERETGWGPGRTPTRPGASRPSHGTGTSLLVQRGTDDASMLRGPGPG